MRIIFQSQRALHSDQRAYPEVSYINYIVLHDRAHAFENHAENCLELCDHIHCGSKKGPLYFCPYLSQILADFQNFSKLNYEVSLH
jgi:hypothetical protein